MHSLTRRKIWSEQIFGPGYHRGPIGPLKHLEKEAREARDSFIRSGDSNHVQEELADCLFLVLDANWRAGFSPDSLLAACEQKLDKNRLRIWPDWRTVDPNSAVEHDRTDERIAKKSRPADAVFYFTLGVLTLATIYVILTRLVF